MANSDALIRRTVSNHNIIEKLGCGGMGVVDKAGDTHLNRFLALKFAAEDLARGRQASVRFPLTVHSVKALSSGGCDAK